MNTVKSLLRAAELQRATRLRSWAAQRTEGRSSRRAFSHCPSSTTKPVETPEASTEEPSSANEHTIETSETSTPLSADSSPPPWRTKRPLPLSPLMDPAVIAAREKHRLPKGRPSAELTPFQRQLRDNPYAQALASPMRACAISRVRLPGAFLLNYEMLQHPSTGAPWFLPASLAANAPSSKQQPSPQTHAPTPSLDTPTPHHTYSLARHSLLTHMTHPKNLRYSVKGLLTPRLVEKTRIREDSIVLREDMPGFVLGLMRTRVVHELGRLVRYGKGYVAACEEGKGLEGVGRKKDVGCVLWMGEGEGLNDEGTDKGEETFEEPAPYATVCLQRGPQRVVTVYNLPRLLGERHIATLREKLGRNGDKMVYVLKNRRMTTEVQMWLWKLQGYLVEDGRGWPAEGEDEPGESV